MTAPIVFNLAAAQDAQARLDEGVGQEGDERLVRASVGDRISWTYRDGDNSIVLTARAVADNGRIRYADPWVTANLAGEEVPVAVSGLCPLAEWEAACRDDSVLAARLAGMLRAALAGGAA